MASGEETHSKSIQRQQRFSRRLGRLRVPGLLNALGVPLWVYQPRSRAYRNGSIWNRNINHLEVLEVAKRLYRKQAKIVHPRARGDCEEASVRLNYLWATIRERFKRQGYEI